MIYFVLAGRYVKIGYAGHVRKRLLAIQTHSPERLVLLGMVEGGRDEEREMHERFQHLHVRGEWFLFGRAIERYVENEAIPYDPRIPELEVASPGQRRPPRRFTPHWPARPKRIRVWVQQFQDRDNLVLQWHDPDTGKRKSKSADTMHQAEAEQKRTVLEAILNAQINT